MSDFSNALIWVGFFSAVFFGWYFYIKARNKERMALIERDKDVSEIYSKQKISIKFPWLKIGLLFAGIGLGMALSTLIVSISSIKMSLGGLREDIQISSMIFFGGLGIVIGYFLEKPSK